MKFALADPPAARLLTRAAMRYTGKRLRSEQMSEQFAVTNPKRGDVKSNLIATAAAEGAG